MEVAEERCGTNGLVENAVDTELRCELAKVKQKLKRRRTEKVSGECVLLFSFLFSFSTLPASFFLCCVFSSSASTSLSFTSSSAFCFSLLYLLIDSVNKLDVLIHRVGEKRSGKVPKRNCQRRVQSVLRRARKVMKRWNFAQSFLHLSVKQRCCMN